jgi:hypothetical protein
MHETQVGLRFAQCDPPAQPQLCRTRLLGGRAEGSGVGYRNERAGLVRRDDRTVATHATPK